MSSISRFPLPGVINRENTSRIITNEYQTPAFASTIGLVITKARTLVQPAVLTGIVTFTANVDTSDDDVVPFVGDELDFLLVSDGTSRVVTFGTGFASTGTLSVTTAKYGSISFRFNGTVWQETKRAVTA